MVDRDVLDRRLGRLEEVVADLRSLQARGRAEVLGDRGLLAQLERWLHLAGECAADIAQHVIADQGWATPGTYREAFVRLREYGVIDEDLARRMAGWAGLRNVVVHAYLDLDHERLLDALDELDDLEHFAAAVAAWVRALRS